MQLRLVYQPVIDLRSDKIVGFEALVRWDHPTRGVIQPDAFIPIAESSGIHRRGSDAGCSKRHAEPLPNGSRRSRPRS